MNEPDYSQALKLAKVNETSVFYEIRKQIGYREKELAESFSNTCRYCQHKRLPMFEGQARIQCEMIGISGSDKWANTKHVCTCILFKKKIKTADRSGKNNEE